MTGRDAELIDRIQARFGTALMVMASVFAVLIFCDRTGAAMPNMPAIWYSSRGVHLVVCGGLFLMAAILLAIMGAWHWASHRNACVGDCKPLSRPE